MKKFYSFLAVLSISAMTLANDAEIDGIFYNFDNSTLTAMVTYSGSNCYDVNEYVGEVIIPDSVTYDGVTYSVTSIDYGAFWNCSGLTSVTIPNSITSIDYGAFWNCSGLTSVTIPNSVTSISDYAFWNCSGLTSVTIPNSVTSISDYAFRGCTSLTSITIPNSITSIGSSAFEDCNSLTTLNFNAINCNFDSDITPFLNCPINTIIIGDNVQKIPNSFASGNSLITSITIPNSVTSIGSSAFKNCTGLTSITIPNSVTSIGSSAFKNSITDFLFFEGSIPPILDSYDIIDESCFFIIPDEAYDAYCAEYSEVVSRIIPYSKHNQVVNITASDNTSALLTAIGEENTQFVVRLKITGSINSYDLMVMNNKMTNLRYLDLSEARVVANPYEFYSGVCTQNDECPPYAFFQKTTLKEVQLPNSVTSIGNNAFYGCTSLTSITIPNSVTSISDEAFSGCIGLTSVSIGNSVTSIGNEAFYSCTGLTSVSIGNSVTFISDYAFGYCFNLTSVTIPNSVTSIGNDAFRGCTGLTSVSVGNSVTSIGNEAFNDCSQLKKIKIPSSVLTVGSFAFYNCQLDTVYTYTIEPTSISQNTFSCYETAVLAVPEQAYYNYYWDTQWSQFTEIIEFNEPYDNFYLQGDYTSDDNTGRIDGNPDVTQYPNSGYIVEGEEMQTTDEMEIKHNGTSSGGSVIANGNLSADSLRFSIDITANKWHFFSFPFDINLKKNITYSGNYVFRYYDGEERAQYGHGGWKNVSGNHLHATHGYIFQGDTNGKLILSWNDITFQGENKRDTLHLHPSSNSQDESWNLVGNPYCSYYGLQDTDYPAPITIWNGSTYVAYNPMDDDYYLYPFQAFFVQCPESVEGIDFDKNDRKTKNGSEKAKAQKLTMSRMATQIDVERQLVNLTISNDSLSDRTRIVFNNQKSMDYEMECDAAKFISTEAPQIYSLDTKDVKYAINERPLSAGTVDLGYSVSQAGVYKIAAPRMDCEVELEDKESGAEFNLTLGDYEFTSEAGTFENRFVLRIVNAVTKVETTFAEVGVKVLSTPEGILIEGAEQNDVRIYDVRGQLLQTVDTSDLIRLPKAIYIVRVGQQSTKVVVK